DLVRLLEEEDLNEDIRRDISNGLVQLDLTKEVLKVSIKHTFYSLIIFYDQGLLDDQLRACIAERRTFDLNTHNKYATVKSIVHFEIKNLTSIFGMWSNGFRELEKKQESSRSWSRSTYRNPQILLSMLGIISRNTAIGPDQKINNLELNLSIEINSQIWTWALRMPTAVMTVMTSDKQQKMDILFGRSSLIETVKSKLILVTQLNHDKLFQDKQVSKKQQKFYERALVKLEELCEKGAILHNEIQEAQLGFAYERIYFQNEENVQGAVKLKFNSRHMKEDSRKIDDLLPTFRIGSLSNYDHRNAIPVEIDRASFDLSHLQKKPQAGSGRLVLKTIGIDERIEVDALAGFHRYEVIQMYRDGLRDRLQTLEAAAEDVEEMD
ncbi:hypothetical protein BDN72DRAFT_866400, partial [Pluteus cervinus]